MTQFVRFVCVVQKVQWNVRETEFKCPGMQGLQVGIFLDIKAKGQVGEHAL